MRDDAPVAADRTDRERSARLRGASPYLLAGLMATAGVTHFLLPAPYERIVPDALPAQRAIVYVSGVVEIACAGLLAAPRTRRVGGWLTAGLLVAVFPANVKNALDAQRDPSLGLAGSSLVTWLRLPLQVPLVLWAARVARRVV